MSDLWNALISQTDEESQFVVEEEEVELCDIVHANIDFSDIVI